MSVMRIIAVLTGGFAAFIAVWGLVGSRTLALTEVEFRDSNFWIALGLLLLAISVLALALSRRD